MTNLGAGVWVVACHLMMQHPTFMNAFHHRRDVIDDSLSLQHDDVIMLLRRTVLVQHFTAYYHIVYKTARTYAQS